MTSAAELERMMKLQDVILKAMAKKISWIEAAEIAGVTDRTMRRMRERYQEFGYNGLFDQRRGKRSMHRVAMETAEEVLRLYREIYFDLNMRHFHEKLRDEPNKGTAFRRTSRADLNWIFTVQTERVVAKDNTVAIGDRTCKLTRHASATRWRAAPLRSMNIWTGAYRYDSVPM